MGLKSQLHISFTSASVKISDPPWTAKVIRQAVKSSSEGLQNGDSISQEVNSNGRSNLGSEHDG